MPSSIVAFLALSLAFAGLGGQGVPDDTIAQTRLHLEGQRRDLLVKVADRAWMLDSSRAAIVRLSIERNWEACAANEGWALAKASERPARLLAEQALTACRVWEQAFVAALRNGADPYRNAHVSSEDMATAAQLQSRDAALARIMLWRGVPVKPMQPAAPAPPIVNRDGTLASPTIVRATPSILSQQAFPNVPIPEAAVRVPPAAAVPSDGEAQQEEIVVVGQAQNRCAVRLADRTLTESQLAANAKQWAAAGTALRVVRPRDATYGCLAKIARQLNEYGVHLLQIVEP